MTQKRPIGARHRHRVGHAHRVDQETVTAFQGRLVTGLAQKIAETMRALDISTDELAAALGVGRTAVMHWVSGRELPSLWRLGTIAIALRCSILDLIPNEVLVP